MSGPPTRRPGRSAPVRKIGIVGGGAWGTALAAVAHGAGREAVVWARETEVVEAINGEHRNTVYLPEVELDPDIRASAEVGEACAADAVLFVAPAQHAREVAALLAPHLEPGVPLVICSKGIEAAGATLMSETLAEVLPETPLAVLSGPTFAIPPPDPPRRCSRPR